MADAHKSEDRRLTRSNAYLGKDRDELREIILDRDEEIERLRDDIQTLTHQRDITHDELVHFQNAGRHDYR